MAVDMFMKIGSLKGESRDKSHKDEIDVIAWSWGVSNQGTSHTGSGGGTGKANVHDLSFTKFIDKSSPNLMLSCCNGKHYDSAVLTVRKAGEKPVEYLVITLSDVMITNVATGASAGDDRLVESVQLHFNKVKLEYKEQTDKGATGGSVNMTWNVAENTAG